MRYSQQFNALIMPEYIRASCQYLTAPEAPDPAMALRITVYSDMEQARLQYEQDRTGEVMTVQNVPVYHYTNNGKSVYLWSEANTLLWLTINLEDLDETDIVQDVIKWRQLS